MVTDGVLDAFGEEPGEEILKEWILQAQEQMPKELGGICWKNITVCRLPGKR